MSGAKPAFAPTYEEAVKLAAPYYRAMTEEDREFVREQMAESRHGPLINRPIDWIIGKTFFMNDFLAGILCGLFAFCLAIPAVAMVVCAAYLFCVFV
ncbi:hypothetical protein [uncultured Senegalimassilia sp.]|uniref:hypothetical protein n=2 Tax=uncultured Senegalimassilia sp. TaxID=1714350 RepID=UPI0027DD6447|nr:hypothetical protein [uncultured Senegalimassilia sp.]